MTNPRTRRIAYGLLLPALLMAGCGTGDDSPPTVAGPDTEANRAFWGTDAQISPGPIDAVLRYGEHPRAFAELRIPEGEGPFPLAVIFHGGCWKAGLATQAYMGPLATDWQDKGVATLNVDYREVGDGGGWPGSFEDWAGAGALIDQVARDYPVDRERVTLVGHSAGGLPAQWLAMAQDADGPLGARSPVPVRSAIVFDGPADVGAEQEAFDALCQFSAVEPFMGRSPATAISPTRHAPRLEELLFVQAKLPAPVETAQAAIRAGETRLNVRSNEGASHFDVITPGSDAYRANEAAVLKVLRGE